MRRVTTRILELCGPLQLPDNLQDFDGVRLYCSVQDQIKGYITVWNPYRPFLTKKARYPTDFGSWLLLANILFSPLGGQIYDQQILKTLICKSLGISPEGLETEYIPPPVVLPELTASILIPTLDRPDELTRALERLSKHKTGVQHEIIIVDNNPGSGLTRPIVNRFVGVRYVEEPRKGEFYARNAGLIVARGDILVSTDDDIVIGEGWLDNLIAPFADSQVAAVMGLVLPFELNTRSQELFEEMGGLNLGYEWQRFDADFFRPKTTSDKKKNPPLSTTPYGFAYFYKSKGIFPEFGRLGNTSCSAFRYSTFAHPRIGPFEEVLSRAGGDSYQFYKILAAGYVSIYQPKIRAFHKHRTTMAGLRMQWVYFERGHISRLLVIGLKNKDRRALAALRYLPYYEWRRLQYAMSGKSSIPFHLTLVRIWGNLIAPVFLWGSIRHCKKLGRCSVQQVADNLAKREPLLAQAETKPKIKAMEWKQL